MANVHEIFASDLLHQVIKPFTDHVVQYTIALLEKHDPRKALSAEVDRRCGGFFYVGKEAC
jgi:hypothetical protein